MKKDLLTMDRLPTLGELKEFFKNNDWTTKGDNSITKKEQVTLLRYIENTNVHKKECS